ncbi:RNA-directed DNA polymerase, eukaryota, reverse transcriptase zinc-binding domain protein [Tanacetum coccineum]
MKSRNFLRLAKDLWNTCKQYGNVVDAYIPNTRSKAEMEIKPAVCVDNSCLNQHDYSNFLMGKVKDFVSLSNLKVVLASNDFIIDGRVTWVEIVGIPLKMWSKNTFNRIASIWDTLLHVVRIETPRSGGSILQLIGDMVKNGEVIIMGDFNEVRKKAERFGSVFNVQGADAFNMFISNAGLEEVPLGGCSFTWCHKSANKMSKLDLFLISESLLSLCPNISVVSLDRYLSDHRSILMRESYYDYGHVPFRFFHYWFDMEGFDKLVEESWKAAPVADTNAIIKMMKKLKYLKENIHKGEGDEDVVNKRANVDRSLQELEKLQSVELAIRGILIDENWTESPNLVKSEFLSHFKKCFDQPQKTRLQLDMNFPNILNSNQQADLECEVTKDEIKRAVWDCGTDKSRGPDGFTFGFYRRYWKIIESVVVDAVSCFFQKGYFPKGGNSSFITLIPKTHDANKVKDFRPISLIGSLYKIIAKLLVNRLVVVLGSLVNEVQSAFVADRQILDGPFILNEIFQWCKSKKKQSLVFKVDFEKAYDSVRWDYLDDILRKFGFGDKWRVWIQNCLRSSRGSVIVNGSPTEEFQFYKGLKQGDSLSSFLFILVMESLQSRSKSDGCSKLLGISVEAGKMDQAARKIDCVTLQTPFKYLGSKVGDGLLSQYPNLLNETVEDTLFWEDGWRGGNAFKYLYPRVYALKLSKNIDVASKMAHCTLLTDMRDKWSWSLEGSGDFSVGSVRKLLDGNLLPEVASKMRWIKAMPIKVNVYAWRVKLDCLPTRINISRRGMEIKSIICPMCGEAAESSRHIFFSCHIARQILRKISRWWDVSYIK